MALTPKIFNPSDTFNPDDFTTITTVGTTSTLPPTTNSTTYAQQMNAALNQLTANPYTTQRSYPQPWESVAAPPTDTWTPHDLAVAVDTDVAADMMRVHIVASYHYVCSKGAATLYETTFGRLPRGVTYADRMDAYDPNKDFIALTRLNMNPAAPATTYSRGPKTVDLTDFMRGAWSGQAPGLLLPFWLSPAGHALTVQYGLSPDTTRAPEYEVATRKYKHADRTIPPPPSPNAPASVQKMWAGRIPEVERAQRKFSDIEVARLWGELILKG